MNKLQLSARRARLEAKAKAHVAAAKASNSVELFRAHIAAATSAKAESRKLLALITEAA